MQSIWKFLGYGDPPDVCIKIIRLLGRNVQLGEDLIFDVTPHSDSDQSQRLVVDYTIHHVKAKGQTNPKVFELKTLTREPGSRCDVSKRRITTRRFYSGQHSVEIVIIGRSFGKREFELTGV